MRCPIVERLADEPFTATCLRKAPAGVVVATDAGDAPADEGLRRSRGRMTLGDVVADGVVFAFDSVEATAFVADLLLADARVTPLARSRAVELALLAVESRVAKRAVHHVASFVFAARTRN